MAITANDKRKDPSKPSLAHQLMAPRIDLVETLMNGTESLRAKGEAYLPKYERESDKNYKERLSRSVLVNYFRRTVESLVGKPFSKPVVIEDDMPKELVDLAENIDHQGNHLNVFARRVFRDGLVKGLTHIMVEYPNTEALGVQTKEDEDRINAKPYFVHIFPENVLAAHYEIRNGEEFLTHVRIYETETVRVEFDEMLVERIRVLEPGIWQLYQKNPKTKKWELESSGTTTLNYIPLVTYYSEKEDFMMARPPLTDLAYVNVAHYQSGSDQRNILTVSRFPMLAASGINEEESKTEVGPRQLLTCMDKDGKYYYVEHSGAAISSGREDLKDLEEQMSILGAELLKKSGNPTATAKAIDTAENTSLLQSMVLSFADSLERCFQIAADWMNLGVETGSIVINTDFGLTLDGQDLQALATARANKDISREAYLHELQRRGALSDDFDVEADAELLDKESEKALSDQVLSQRMMAEAVAEVDSNNQTKKEKQK